MAQNRAIGLQLAKDGPQATKTMATLHRGSRAHNLPSRHSTQDGHHITSECPKHKRSTNGEEELLTKKMSDELDVPVWRKEGELIEEFFPYLHPQPS